jgi:tetratricopeptide (TPR) repeat protein
MNDTVRNFLLPVLAAALFGAGCAHQAAFTTPKLEILNQQIRSNTNNAQAYSNRGYTLALLGQKEAARADLRRAVTLKDTAPLHNGAGFSYFNLGDYAMALREWQTAAEMSRHGAHYDYYSLALGHWGVGEKKGALENYQQAVEHDPRFGEAKALNERTIEWTALERKAIHEIYVLWSKTWRP